MSKMHQNTSFSHKIGKIFGKETQPFPRHFPWLGGDECPSTCRSRLRHRRVVGLCCVCQFDCSLQESVVSERRSIFFLS